MGGIQTIEANASSQQDRCDTVAAMVSQCFSSTWRAEPLAEHAGASSVSWMSGDGIAVSRAQMAPVRLTNTCGSAPARRRYYVCAANQFATVRSYGMPAIALQPNEIVLFSSSIPSDWTMTRAYETSSLIFDEDLLRDHIPDPEALVGRRLRLPPSFQQTLKSMIDAVWDASSGRGIDQVGEAFARAFLQTLAIAASSELPCAETQPVFGKALGIRRDQIMHYVRHHYHEPDLSVSMLAERLHFSPRYVQLAFAGSDLTPSQFIRQTRLEACARLLEQGPEEAKSITEISFDCGFNSSAHFSTQFREHFGMTPRAYRSSARRQS